MKITAGGTCAFGVCTGDQQTICNTTAQCAQAGGVCDTDFLDVFPTESLSRNPITGAIETVVAHPTNADILWVGGVNGGVFRTQNATAASPSWTTSTDGLGSISIGALELDPTDATSNTLVAGIGLTSAYGNEGGSRTGLLRTTDGGSSWRACSSGCRASWEPAVSRACSRWICRPPSRRPSESLRKLCAAPWSWSSSEERCPRFLRPVDDFPGSLPKRGRSRP